MQRTYDETGSLKLLRHFPQRFEKELEMYLRMPALTQIRVRVGQPVQVGLSAERLIFLAGTPVTLKECHEMFESVCEHSVYAYENELKEGFLTLQGGCRAGFGGRFVVERGEIVRIHAPTFFHFRIAREWRGCARPVMPYLLRGKRVLNTLILSPPGCGKTTLLRDIARTLSYRRYNVCVVDERCEIAGGREGVPGLDLGPCCDVFEACPKAPGMMMALRVMGPEVLLCDEIGKKDEIEAVLLAARCGCSTIATAHASDLEELRKRLGEDLPFERFLVLGQAKGPGTLMLVLDREGNVLFDGGDALVVHG